MRVSNEDALRYSPGFSRNTRLSLIVMLRALLYLVR